MKRHNIKRFALLSTFLGVLFFNSYSQQVSTVYFMENIPERSSYNPAFQPGSNFYLDLPVLPNFRYEGGNNSVTFKDIIFSKNINGIDSTITFLHPDANKDDFYNSLRSTTRVYSDLTFNLLSFGFRVKKKNYFTFNMSQKVESSIYLPKDLFKLALYGTPDVINNNSYNLSKFGIDFSCYTEIALGYSRKFNDKLTLGANFKYLIGQANISTKIDNFTIDGGIDKWTINGEGSINSSLPLTEIPIEQDGSINFDNITTTSFDQSQIKSIALTSNNGLGLDIGGTYKIIPALELSASLTNLGFIRWRENVTNASLNGGYEFTGIKYAYKDDINDKLDTLQKNFEDAFVSNGSKNHYTTYLSPKLNLGAEYRILHDKIGFGLLSTTLFADKTAFEDATVSVNFHPCYWFGPSISYSLVNGETSSIGLGLQLQLMCFNFYIAADRIPLTFTSDYYPTKLKSANVQMGMVWCFGSDQRDDDKDGVRNKKDKCPNTPLGYLVDKHGCIIDTDGDGIPDNIDKCPNTPKGIPVDSVGCPLDDDKDGIINPLDKCPNTPIGVAVDSVGCPMDNDKDGVPDYLDKCPNTPIGTKVDSIGCPLDSDGDGVPDYLDACAGTPIEARGTVDAKGCPIDTDGDGVPDYLDKCPNTPIEARGKVDINGCPLDTDGDGIPDYMDNCPMVKGTVTNHGCPELKAEVKRIFEKALQGIQFQTGKDIIKSSSFGILNQIVTIMKENPTYSIQINGHTDNVGKPQANQILSEKRAKSVMDYLAKKGVESKRMASNGYGDMIPVDNNATAKGRAKNRRVEFIVKFEE